VHGQYANTHKGIFGNVRAYANDHKSMVVSLCMDNRSRIRTQKFKLDSKALHTPLDGGSRLRGIRVGPEGGVTGVESIYGE
jgi:hypothetical protein